jgi:hypothetical protein
LREERSKEEEREKSAVVQRALQGRIDSLQGENEGLKAANQVS